MLTSWWRYRKKNLVDWSSKQLLRYFKALIRTCCLWRYIKKRGKTNFIRIHPPWVSLQNCMTIPQIAEELSGINGGPISHYETSMARKMLFISQYAANFQVAWSSFWLFGRIIAFLSDLFDSQKLLFSVIINVIRDKKTFTLLAPGTSNVLMPNLRVHCRPVTTGNLEWLIET